MLWAALLVAVDYASAQPHGALPVDPRHHFDKRCPPAVTLDPGSKQRDPTSSSSYLWTPMPHTATVSDCARACCGDWSCESFAFVKPIVPPPLPSTQSLSGDWVDHDSLRGDSDISILQSGTQLSATSLQPRRSFWAKATGQINPSGTSGFIFFTGSQQQQVPNNRSFRVSADGKTMFLERLAFDPVGFTQNFTRAAQPFGPGGNCTGRAPCCIFKDDIDPLVEGKAGVTTAVRAKLPAVAAPYPNSTLVTSGELI